MLFKNNFNNNYYKEILIKTISSVIEVIKKHPSINNSTQDLKNIEIIHKYNHRLFYEEMIINFINNKSVEFNDISVNLYNMILDLINEISNNPIPAIFLIKNGITLELLILCLKCKRNIIESEKNTEYNSAIFNNFAIKVIYLHYLLIKY